MGTGNIGMSKPKHVLKVVISCGFDYNRTVVGFLANNQPISPSSFYQSKQRCIFLPLKFPAQHSTQIHLSFLCVLFSAGHS